MRSGIKKKELEAMNKKFECGKSKFYEQQEELKEARNTIADLRTQLAAGREARAALLDELNENQIKIKNLEQQVGYSYKCNKRIEFNIFIL